MELPANNILGTNLRQWRVDHKISIIDVMKEVDIDQRYYQRIERGGENPSLKTLTLVNAYLKIPWERMMPPIGCLCVLPPYSARRCPNGGRQSPMR
ncbi:MAG: helix-turn-helix transcriptional regulator [Limisphaerales bacterium]